MQATVVHMARQTAMSPWTHTLCEGCWNFLNPDRPVPHRLVEAEVETCCRCGMPTTSGIYVREEPNKWGRCNHSEEG